MKKLRVIARVLVISNDKLLLVRNRNANFWYPPGGGWEYAKETIKECASREVFEETGYQVDIKELLWTQEFREGQDVFFETFWRAELAATNTQGEAGLDMHQDADENGAVEEARWFTEEELTDKKVFPGEAKKFTSIEGNQPDPFLGNF